LFLPWIETRKTWKNNFSNRFLRGSPGVTGTEEVKDNGNTAGAPYPPGPHHPPPHQGKLESWLSLARFQRDSKGLHSTTNL
jgi:hypothetical protein